MSLSKTFCHDCYVLVLPWNIFPYDIQNVKWDVKHPLNYYEPAHENLVLIALASIEGSGEPAQMRRLAGSCAARIHRV